MSGAPLDMTLDDLIKQNKKSGGGSGRGRGRGGSRSGPGPSRRFSDRAANRSTPYSAPKAPETAWNHDMFSSDQAMAYSAQVSAAGSSSIETGTKLHISNLDYGVSNEDIKELFSEAGDLKRYSIHYDRSGRSKGTAEVVFARRQDAVAAVKRYNNVQLDGKPMKIEIAGTNIVTPAAAPAFVNGGFGDSYGAPPRRSAQGRIGGFGRPRGGGGGGGGGGGRDRDRDRGFGGGGRRGRGRGGGGRGEKVVSAEDLDADLEKYHKGAMEIN